MKQIPLTSDEWYALRQTLAYCKEEEGKSQLGYFSSGWAGTMLRNLLIRSKNFKTIQDFVQLMYPVLWETGNWGCMQIGTDGETVESLKKQYPNGELVDTDVGQYWLWESKA